MNQTDKADDMSRNKQSMITANDYNLQRVKTLTAGQISKQKNRDSRASSFDESLLRNSQEVANKKLKKATGGSR